MSKPSWRTIGSTIGTKISTIGTHSSGQASRKMTIMMIARIIIFGSSRLSNAWLTTSGVPRRENTPP